MLAVLIVGRDTLTGISCTVRTDEQVDSKHSVTGLLFPEATRLFRNNKEGVTSEMAVTPSFCVENFCIHSL